MKETPNRGYPYPECAPPLVQDAADLPLDLFNLASAIDDDVTALITQANAALNPPSAALANTVTLGPFASGSIVPFDFIVFDNTGSSMAVIGATAHITATVAGLYEIAASLLGNPSAGTINSLQLQILVNGAAIESYTGTALTAGTGAALNMGARLLLAAGDQVQLGVVFPGGSTLSATNTRLAITKVISA